MIVAAIAAACGLATGKPTAESGRWNADVGAEEVAAQAVSFDCASAADSPAQLKATQGPNATHAGAVAACLHRLQQTQDAVNTCVKDQANGLGPKTKSAVDRLKASLSALLPLLAQAEAAARADDSVALTTAKDRIAALQGELELAVASN